MFIVPTWQNKTSSFRSVMFAAIALLKELLVLILSGVSIDIQPRMGPKNSP